MLARTAQNPCYDWIPRENSTNVLKKIVCEKRKNPVIPRAYNRTLARTRAKSKNSQKKFLLKPKCPKNFVFYIPNACKNFSVLDMVL